MSIVKILSEGLVNQIAAGEVVERPASVVKELIENSIDSGASDISVEIKDGGKTFIKVSDNGWGMSREDLEMSLKRHATSKISEEKDLWNIKTMGFRGEALSSIASVSKMTISSRTASDVYGAEIDVKGGDIFTIRDKGMACGTCVQVFDLFFNTPARQKYLKADSTELGHITSIMNTIALANFGISFKLAHNGKVVFDLPKVTDLGSRISDIFGANTREALIPIFYGGADFQIDGFIGKPLLSRSSNHHQYFFVNGRPIQHFLLANTIKSAYHSMLMENKKPVFIVNIRIDPSLVDVNVHPRKVEIRFEDQQAMIKTMYGCVKTALDKSNLIPKGFTESQRYMSDKLMGTSRNSFGDEKSPKIYESFSRDKSSNVQDALKFTKNILAQRDQQNLNAAFSMRPVTQVANSYIVAENEEGLVLIDQHAAHERVRYEQLMNQVENKEKTIQPLLVPLQIEFSADEAMLVEENKNIFNGLGFQIEPFGGKTFIISAVPGFLANEDIDSVINGVIDDILNLKAPSNLQGRSEVILTYMACRSAIKFGQKLNMDEMEGLIRQMDNCKRPWTCPHGRPTMVKLTLSELERMFGRK